MVSLNRGKSHLHQITKKNRNLPRPEEKKENLPAKQAAISHMVILPTLCVCVCVCVCGGGCPGSAGWHGESGIVGGQWQPWEHMKVERQWEWMKRGGERAEQTFNPFSSFLRRTVLSALYFLLPVLQPTANFTLSQTSFLYVWEFTLVTLSYTGAIFLKHFPEKNWNVNVNLDNVKWY